MWIEAVTKTAKPLNEWATMFCVMQGQDIVKYRRENYPGTYDDATDEDVLNDHRQVYWADPCKDPSALKLDNE
jgi:hypothetical protein